MITFTPLFSNSDSITMHLLPLCFIFILQGKTKCQKGTILEKKKDKLTPMLKGNFPNERKVVSADEKGKKCCEASLKNTH